MSFFVLALIVDWYVGRVSLNPARWITGGQWRVLVEKLSLALMGAAAAVMAGHAQRTVMAAKSLAEWGVEQRAIQSAYGLAFYLWKTVWPGSLSALYQLPSKMRATEGRFIAAYVTIAVVLVAVVALWKKWPAVPAAFAAYLVLLLPVLGIAQSGDQFVADRYSYLACIPLTLLLAGGIQMLWNRLQRPSQRAALATGLGAWILVLTCATWVQADVWHDTETLWRHAADATPSSMVYGYLGEELDHQGRVPEATDCYSAAVELNPENGRAWYALGNLLVQGGKYAEAEAAFKMAAAKMPQRYIAYMNLGTLYLYQLNRPNDAEAAYRAAVEDVERPRRIRGEGIESSLPYMGMGDVMAKTGRKEDARAWFEKARGFEKTRELAEKALKKLDEGK
jgi:tetratricopeptide (TPR) repeat protein